MACSTQTIFRRAAPPPVVLLACVPLLALAVLNLLCAAALTSAARIQGHELWAGGLVLTLPALVATVLTVGLLRGSDGCRRCLVRLTALATPFTCGLTLLTSVVLTSPGVRRYTCPEEFWSNAGDFVAFG